ncbi:MAG: SDR family oxidoreductase [Acidobacteria bacterium]|nr:SDR family oxidoreductase [Acidobacteriota bacterium]
MSRYTRRVALVTGANRGLGLEISRQLADRDIAVVMAAREEDKGRRAVAGLAGEGRDIHFLQLDVTELPRILQAVDFIWRRFGRLDILVNNAGIMPDKGIKASVLTAERLTQTLVTNVYGPLLLAQACLPLMREGGYGRIVNLSSRLGSLTEMAAPDSPLDGVDAPAYRLSKTALNAVTTLLARDTRGENILINSACPGWVRTNLGGPRAPLSVEQGADTPVWLATLPPDGPHGGFFQDRTPIDW